MDESVKNQIHYGIKYLPSFLAKSFFIKKSSAASMQFRNKHGFITGVCHPDDAYNDLKEANIQWVRFDIPFPFNKDHSLSDSYTAFKNRCSEFKNNNIKVMAITPYPKDYIEYGADIRTKQGEEKVREIARFLITDLKDIVSGIQVTNEMGIPRFTLPLTMDEAIKFIGIQLEAMYPIKNNIILGYNSAGPDAYLHVSMKKWHRFCDYVGIDVYLGCFFTMPGFMFMYKALLRYLWAATQRPILIQEFGYISEGKAKSKKDKQNLLLSYGVKSESEAKKHIEAFVDALPKDFGDHIKYISSGNKDEYYNLIFKGDIKNHLYKELPAVTKIPHYEHTKQGQAKFFRDVIDLFYQFDFVCGAFIYCYSDSDKCYVCCQKDCPTETRWGLVSTDKQKKPSYYAVKNTFGRIKWYQNTEKLSTK